MRQRLITLIATLALLITGAVPAMAAPGGVPGPPDGHGKKGNDSVVEEAEEDDSKLPEWAKAYGKRIKDEFGLTYGHLMQCDDEDKASDLCPEEALEIPEDTHGASAFAIWYFTDEEVLVLGL